MSIYVEKRTITKKLEAVLDVLDVSLEGMYTREDADRLIKKLLETGSKSNRPSILKRLFTIFDAIGVTYEKGRENEYYVNLVEKTDFPVFSQIEERFLYALYLIYDKYLSPEDYMRRIVDKLSVDNWKEDTLRVRILKQFIKYGNYLVDAGFGGRLYIQSYVKTTLGVKKVNDDDVLINVDDGVFDALGAAAKPQKKPEGKFGLLKLADDLASGKFRTGGATKKGLYLFAMVYGMTYYSGQGEFTDYDTDIELNLFTDYYANNLMRYVSDAYKTNLCEYELDPTGVGINYKNFAEMIYIYYISSDFSSQEKIKLSSEMIDRVASSEFDYELAKSPVDTQETVLFRNRFFYSNNMESSELLELGEAEFEQYMCQNYNHNTTIMDPISGKSHVVGVLQLESEHNTAYEVYTQLLEDLEYEDVELENCNYGLWFAEEDQFKESSRERLLAINPSAKTEKIDDFVSILHGVNSFMGYKTMKITDASSVTRTSIIVAYYYYYNAINLDKDGISSFNELFEDFKQGVDELLEEAFYQPFSGKNIFDVLVAFSSYAYLSV